MLFNGISKRAETSFTLKVLGNLFIILGLSINSHGFLFILPSLKRKINKEGLSLTINLDKNFYEKLEKELEKNTSIKNTKEYYLEMISLFLDHVEEKKEIYVAIGKANKNGIMMDMIYDTFKKEIIEGIDKSEQRVKIPSNFVATFYLGAVFSAGTEWLMSDFKYTKEEMLNYLNILIPDGLEIANKK